MGRVVHPLFLDGEAPISASATTAPSHAHTYEGRRPYTQARAVRFGKADRPPIAPLIRKAFRGTLVLNSDYAASNAEVAVASGEADAITFGRPFIANPELPRRIKLGLPLAKENTTTWHTQGAEGYLNYPEAVE